MENINIYGNGDYKIDPKNRIFVKKFVPVTAGEEFAVLKNNQYYNIILLSRLEQIITAVREESLNIPRENMEMLLKELKHLYSCIMETMKMDSQGRVILPQEIKDASEEKVHLQGQRTNLALFPTQKIYQDYQENKIEDHLIHIL